MCDIESIITSVENWARQSVFVYPTILSLISAVIFFYFFEVLPKRKEKNNIKDQVIHLTERILGQIMFIIQHATNDNIDQTRIRSFRLSKEEITTALATVKMTDPLKHLRTNSQGQPMTVGESVATNIHQLQTDCETLFRYILHLDTDLIKYLNEALRNTFLESWLNSYKRTPVILGTKILTPANKVISYYDELLHDLDATYLSIESWLYKNYPNHQDILRRRLISEFHDKENWKLSVKLARKYRKVTERKNEAISFEIKSLWKLKRLKEAKKIREKGLLSGLLTDEYFKTQIIYDPKFKSMDLMEVT